MWLWLFAVNKVTRNSKQQTAPEETGSLRDLRPSALMVECGGGDDDVAWTEYKKQLFHNFMNEYSVIRTIQLTSLINSESITLLLSRDRSRDVTMTSFVSRRTCVWLSCPGTGRIRRRTVYVFVPVRRCSTAGGRTIVARETSAERAYRQTCAPWSPSARCPAHTMAIVYICRTATNWHTFVQQTNKLPRKTALYLVKVRL